jgi:lysine 2,3-aminomutase
MTEIEQLDKIAISVKSHKLLKQLLKENPRLEEIMRNSRNETEALVGVKNWVLERVKERPAVEEFRQQERPRREDFAALEWQDYAAIRLLDYIDNAGRAFPDLNLRGEIAVSNPIELIWLAVTYGTGGAKPFFFLDMLHLFRQFAGEDKPANWRNR